MQYVGKLRKGDKVAWMNWKQIKKLSDENMFVDVLEYFFTEVDRQ